VTTERSPQRGDAPQPDVVFDGAVAALGTLHDKARDIAPALAELGLSVRTELIDTQAYGTFDGSVERVLSPLEAAAAKAREAAAAAGTRFGLGSEGSFFVHPDLPWCTTDLELVTLVDLDTGLVVTGRHQQPAPWATPGTDLRAHRCPPRRVNIAAAAADLAQRLRSRCADCDAPGVGPVRSEQGRPCGWCGGPTLDLLAVVRGCVRCDWEERVSTEGPADPGTCPRCNP
jgi:hypothetical protein